MSRFRNEPNALALCNTTMSMLLKQLQLNVVSFSIIFNLGLKCFGAIHTHIHISISTADVQKRQSDAFSVLLRSVNMIYHTDVKQTQL